MAKRLMVLILVVLTFVAGYNIGKQHTIQSAGLYDIAEDEYYLYFGDEVHTYTFDE